MTFSISSHHSLEDMRCHVVYGRAQDFTGLCGDRVRTRKKRETQHVFVMCVFAMYCMYHYMYESYASVCVFPSGLLQREE